MSVTFVANVGSRDVQVQNHLNLPKDPRTLGEVILNQWDSLKGDLRLPILVKTLDWVLKKHGQVDQIVLFASDQTDPQYRHTDTLPFAQVIERYMTETYGAWVSSALRRVVITENPSDYDAMYRFYAEALKGLDGEVVYLAVSGGTPAMSFMLLWHGVEILQERAHPLYVIQERTMPLSLNIGQQMLVSAILEDIHGSLRIRQYHAALATLSRHEQTLRRALPHFEAARAVIDYARQRLSFNFKLAEAALFEATRGLPPTLATRIDALAEELTRRDGRWLLREELFGAEIDFANGGYRDAVINVFAFRESLLRQMALQQGMRLDSEYRKLDAGWLNSEPDLASYLTGKAIDLKRNVTTFVFERILDFKAKSDPVVAEFMRQVATLTELADLRNRAAHLHGGVSHEMIAAVYPGGVPAVSAGLRALYEQFAGQPTGDNPYDAINTLIEDLLNP